jgi:integrase
MDVVRHAWSITEVSVSLGISRDSVNRLLRTKQRRLGHKRIQTTQRYLDTLPDAGDSALAALKRVMGE